MTARSRTLLTAILRRGRMTRIDTAEVCPSSAVADWAEVRTMLAGTAAEPFLAEGATRLLDSVSSSSGDAMSALEYAASTTTCASFSLTAWAANPNDQRRMFPPTVLIRSWRSKPDRAAAKTCHLRHHEPAEGDIASTWVVADKLEAIGKIEGLNDRRKALTRRHTRSRWGLTKMITAFANSPCRSKNANDHVWPLTKATIIKTAMVRKNNRFTKANSCVTIKTVFQVTPR